MRVVWTWYDVGHVISGKGPETRLRISMLLGSIFSWKRIYPDDTTVLYCDKETFNVLFREGSILERYADVGISEAYVLDFSTIQKKYQISSEAWAWPKIYTAALQNEPFVELDVDTLLLQEFDRNNILKVYRSYKPGQARFVHFVDLYKKAGYFMKPGNLAIHPAFVYYPDPVVAKYLFVLGRDILRFSQNEPYAAHCAEEFMLGELLGKFQIPFEVLENEVCFHQNNKSNLEAVEFKEILTRFEEYLPDQGQEGWLQKDRLFEELQTLELEQKDQNDENNFTKFI